MSILNTVPAERSIATTIMYDTSKKPTTLLASNHINYTQLLAQIIAKVTLGYAPLIV